MEKSALIIGANGGIGLALTKNLIERGYRVLASYRDEDRSKELLSLQADNLRTMKLDPLDEDSYSDSVILKEKFDLVINTIGILEGGKFYPEKSLRDINISQMQETFMANAFITPLLAKVIKPNLKKEAKFVAISAKVGSIEDNKMGGWYSYRASKAALNMFLKNISIEFGRGTKNLCVLAIHPGTTRTNLSKNFLKNTPYIVHPPEDCAENILNVILAKSKEDNGKFFSWDDKEIPW